MRSITEQAQEKVAQGKVTSFQDTFRLLRGLARRSDDREEAWEVFKAHLQGQEETYTICPVCECTLDWAWCNVCQKGR